MQLAHAIYHGQELVGQLLCHDLDDAGERVERGLRVQEGEPAPACDHVNRGLRVLVADGVADLGLDD